jgi:hypothetical protein
MTGMAKRMRMLITMRMTLIVKKSRQHGWARVIMGYLQFPNIED